MLRTFQIVLMIFPLLLGFAVGRSGTGSPDHWYAQLQKPQWTPPGWVFGGVWSALYLAMGVSLIIVCQKGAHKTQKGRLGLALFAVQLALNLAWSPLFFGAHKPFWALLDLVALIVVLAGTLTLFVQMDKWAGALLVPYFIWVLCAFALNARIWQLNA